MAHARQVKGLHCADSYREAAGKIIRTRFEEMVSFSDSVLEGDTMEGVHDMRVASRRLRAALELFADVFPPRTYRVMLRDIKHIADVLGRVRDADVLIDRLEKDREGRPESQQGVLNDVINDVCRQRDEARQQLNDLIASVTRPRFSRRFLALVKRETT